MEPKILLKQATSAIAQEIKDKGLSPHAATVKVARDLQLNANFIKRASEIINVALSYNHFKKNADCKEVDFPIVDAAKVAAEIYGTKEKTASVYRSDNFSQVVLSDEIPNFTKYVEDEGFKLAFQKILNCEENYDSYDYSAQGLFEKSANVLSWFDSQIDQLSERQIQAKNDFNANFFKLAHNFSKDSGYRISFAEFEKQARSKHGNKILPYIELLHGLVGESRATEEELFEKTASSSFESQIFDAFLKAAADYNTASGDLINMQAEFDNVKSKLKHAYCKFGEKYLSEFDVAPLIEDTNIKQAEEIVEEYIEEDPVMLVVKEKRASEENNITPEEEARYLTPLQASSLPATLKRKIINAKKRKGISHVEKVGKAVDILSVLGNMYNSKSSPGTTQPSTSPQDNLDRKLMLQNIMHTDPLLASKKPQDVAQAYQQMLRLAPEMSNEPEVVKAMLRSMTESQAVDPHTANQLIEANTNLVKQRMLQDSKPPTK